MITIIGAGKVGGDAALFSALRGLDDEILLLDIAEGLPQGEAMDLNHMLSEKGTSISAMLSLKVEDEELIRRLLSRGKDSGRADDQDENIIANRINEYNNKTAPLKQYYSAQNKLSEIKGNGTVKDIAEKLNDVIDTL